MQTICEDEYLDKGNEHNDRRHVQWMLTDRVVFRTTSQRYNNFVRYGKTHRSPRTANFNIKIVNMKNSIFRSFYNSQS